MKKIFYLTMIALLSAACSLEREDYTEIYPETTFQTEKDLELAVNGLYYDFNMGDWNGVYRADYSGYQVASDMTTDVAWSSWGWHADEYYYHQWTATTGNVVSKFYEMYEHYNYLSKARNTVRRIEASPVDKDIKARYIGEAKALRGWMGLFLYDMFGPVPVPSDEILDNPEKFVYLPRLTDAEYDKMMEDDLRDAIELLPVITQRGRLSKGAARMLLLKYYMIRGKFTEAETLCRELYAMEGTYALEGDYNAPFSIEKAASRETILQICGNISSTGTCNYMTASFLPGSMPWTGTAEGWGSGTEGGYLMPWAFYDTFEDGDKRTACIYTTFVNKDGETVQRSDMTHGPVVMKYGKDEDMQGSKCANDLVIYRWSDVLLTLAELINRNTGAPTAEAYTLVNKVRSRAGLGNLPGALTYEQFNDALLLERGHEFFWEGLRRQDLIRFGKYVEYANARIDAANRTGGQNYFKVDEAHNRFPLNNTFINESRGAVKQNPGY